MEKLIRELLVNIGEDPNREGLKDTPKRVAKAYKEWFAGYDMCPKEILSTTFEQEEYNGIILLKDVQYYSYCEHHIAAFTGKVSVAYLPKGNKIVGLSKLARLVDCFAKRLQIQERFTHQIGAAIMEHLDAAAAGVKVSGVHTCMCSRGINKQGAEMITESLFGSFDSNNPSMSVDGTGSFDEHLYNRYREMVK